MLPPAVAFLAYAALLAHLLRAGSFWRTPVFLIYLSAFLLALVAHMGALAHPPGLGALPYLEPSLIGLKALAWLEAFMLATERLAPIERKLMLSLLAAVAMIAAVITWGSQPDLYRAARNYANLALATGSVVAVGCFWIAPVKLAPAVRNHCLILAVYFVNLAVFGLVPPKTVTAWRMANLAYFSLSLACCAAWWRLGLKSQPSFQNQLNVR